MRSQHNYGSRLRTRARLALIWPAAASGQISATFHANGARAARLKEPVAPLSGLLQTGGCIQPRSASGKPTGTIETASVVISSEFICTDHAHLPEPLTAPGAAQTCPACLPSPSNQRTFLDPLGHARPFDPSSRLPLVGLRGDRIGSVIVSPREGRKREVSVCGGASTSPAYQGETSPISGRFNPSPALRHLAFPYLSGISSLPNVIGQSDFPGGNHSPAFLRGKKAPFSACQARSEAQRFLRNRKLLNVIK